MISSQYETQALKSHPHVPRVVPILVLIHFVELVLPKLQQLREYFLHEPL